jgi:hypothetical protein
MVTDYKQGDIIKVFWIDSCGTGSIWQNDSNFNYKEHDKSMYNQSIGYFVKLTDVALYLCEGVRDWNEGRMDFDAAANLFAIPLCAILKSEKVQ